MMPAVRIRVKAINPLIDAGFRMERTSIFDSVFEWKIQRSKNEARNLWPEIRHMFLRLLFEGRFF